MCKLLVNPLNCFLLNFFSRLLHVQIANCKYQEAEITGQTAKAILSHLSELNVPVNCAAFHAECCALLVAKSQYDEVCMLYISCRMLSSISSQESVCCTFHAECCTLLVAKSQYEEF